MIICCIFAVWFVFACYCTELCYLVCYLCWSYTGVVRLYDSFFLLVFMLLFFLVVESSFHVILLMRIIEIRNNFLRQ